MSRLMSIVGLVLLGAGVVSAELSSALVSPYLKIQVALAHDSTDGVADAARAIAAEARALGEEGAELVSAADTLADASDLTGARAAFGPLSDALIAYGHATGFGDLKVAYCPMADKSWVQEDGGIANPFYGSAMLTCGYFE